MAKEKFLMAGVVYEYDSESNSCYPFVDKEPEEATIIEEPKQETEETVDEEKKVAAVKRTTTKK